MVTESKSDTGAEVEPGRTGMLLVTATDEESVVLKDVYFRQVHVLSLSPGVSEDEAVRETVAPDPLMNVS